jgi:hypothetical protein
MKTTSNLGGPPIHIEGPRKQTVYKIKTFLLFSTFLCFTIAVSAQSSNSSQELENYKTTWMKDHNVNDLSPEQYEQMKNEWYVSKKQVRSYQIEDGEPVDPVRQKQYENWKGKNFPTGFPSYDLTGDKEKDDAIYDAKKQQWITKYPERYQQMVNESKEMTEAEKKERTQVLNQK